MSTNNGNSVNGLQTIPSGSRKIVQSLKEIVSCSEAEIYATLKDCNMDPNEAVNRLLFQGPFHEVKSKREKKKENKDTTESRSRGASNISNRGSKSGLDRSPSHGVSMIYNSPESGPSHGKGMYKTSGSGSYPTTSSSVSGVAGSITNRQPSGLRDVATTEYKALPTDDAAYGVSSGMPPPPDYQSKTSSALNLYNSANQHHVHRPSSTTSQYNSSQDVSDIDEWPSIEKPAAAKMHSVSESPVESELHPDASDLPFDRIDQHSQAEEVWKGEDDKIENLGTNYLGSTSISTRKIPEEDNSGGASLFEENSYENMGSYQPHGHSFKNQEVENVSVSSVTANLQQLSMQQDDQGLPSDGEGPSVVIPDHLRVQMADCSHLSFGSFGSGMNSVFTSGHSASMPNADLEKIHTDVDVSSVKHSDTRNSEYFGDDFLKNAPDGNLLHRAGASSGSYDASQPEELKTVNIETAHRNQYAFPTSNPDYTFDNSQHLNASFAQSQTSSQMQNLSSFSNVMQQVHTNPLPSTLLAANVHSGRESDLQYSPFPMTQSLPTNFGNSASSIGGSAISIPEALKTSSFPSTQPTPESLSGNNLATGPPLPQHLSIPPYSQPSLPLGPFANMIGYPLLPQSYTYMPSAFQQQFAGNNSYPQSLAAVLPQYKNSASASSLPQSAAVGSGYDGYGSTTTIPGNFLMNPPAAPSGTNLSYDDVLSSQYKDRSHLISQQNENSAMWHHGTNSRTVSAVPASTYYNHQGQNLQSGGFRQGQQPAQSYGALGYPNFYHSQTGISQDHQQPNPRDGSLGGSQGQPKQSQQIWQNGY